MEQEVYPHWRFLENQTADHPRPIHSLNGGDARQIIEELEEKSRRMTNVKIEFFEPPAVPGFGAAGGFSMRLLDKTNTTDYQRLGEVTDRFMEAFGLRRWFKRGGGKALRRLQSILEEDLDRGKRATVAGV